MQVKVVFSLLMTTALGSQGDEAQGSVNSNHYNGCQSKAVYRYETNVLLHVVPLPT